MIYNRNHCFNCGAETDPGEWDYIGNTQVWVCGDPKCNRELSREARRAVEDAADRAREDRYERYW